MKVCSSLDRGCDLKAIAAAGPKDPRSCISYVRPRESTDSLTAYKKRVGETEGESRITGLTHPQI